jgi:hypothetical protein
VADHQVITTVPSGCWKVICNFAKIMGMSHEEAACHILVRGTVDMIGTPGLADLLPRKSEHK